MTPLGTSYHLLFGFPSLPFPLVVLDQISRHIEVLPFDHLAAKIYARLPFRRGSFDRLIAAHALSLGLVLVTDNERDFADIDDLIVENWMR